ncbi:MAG: hypothetical protein C0594_05935 [Marinilabiliales bacterium]|nr:MAG: hypothetical protein C0594_05935 [Marinilabiliales bacterium]
MYGIGDLAGDAFGRARAFGGASIGVASNRYINTKNPAAYAAYDSLSFLFEFGARSITKDYETNSSSFSSTDPNIQYITMGFPITSYLNATMGLLPYSDVGYNVNIETESDLLGDYTSKYYGLGGLNKAFLGLSFDYGRISAGVNASYLYGDLKQLNTLVTDSNYNYQKEINSVIGDFHFTYGLQYTQPVKDMKLTLGAVFENRSAIRSKTSIISGPTSRSPAGTNYTSILYSRIIDTVEYEVDDSKDVMLPMTYGFGVALEKENSFLFAADYSMQDWKPGDGVYFSDSLGSSYTISGGMEFTPDYKAGRRNYLKKMRYRLGGYYNNSYIRIHGEQISDFGISFGVGFPIRQFTSYNTINDKSSVNLSFTMGQRGTVNSNLIKENYYIFTLNLTLQDKWFVKSKFD